MNRRTEHYGMIRYAVSLAVLLAVLCLVPLLLTSASAVQRPDGDSYHTPPHTTPPSAFYPPPRTLTPTFPSLHVLFVVGSATFTHVAAPIEYMLELKRRGHRITWQQPRDLVSHLFKSEAERLSLPFNFSLVDVNLTSWREAVQLLTERPFLEVMDRVASLAYESTYPTLHHGMMEAVRADRPDLVLCDSIADHCLDVVTQLQLPSVVTHCSTLVDEFSPTWHYDTPSSKTMYSHNWHEQPLSHRLYNTFGLLPHLAWVGIGTLQRTVAMKTALGAPISVGGIASLQGRDVLYDSSWAWEWPQYWPPYLHMVGPIPKTWRQARTQLAPSMQRWLDDSKALALPVVYVAMGSLAKLSDQRLRTLATAFATCPALPADMSATANTSLFRVLWANRHSPPWLAELLPASVRLEQWVSQPAVLAHPAVHLFLSHSGMSSAQEAIAVGLPILALPLLIDQPSIAAKLRDRGVADVLDKLTFTSDELCASMRRLVFSAAVRQSASSLQRLFHASDSGGLQRAVDVIERAAVSMAHLRPYRERQEVSWVVRHNVDVYGCGLLAGLAVLWCVVAAVSVVVRLVVKGIRGVVSIVGAASRRKSKQA